MTTNVLRGFQLALIALSLIAVAVLWDKIPATVPIHYNINGTADDFAPKAWGAFMLPFATLFIFLLTAFLPQIDPKRKTEEHIHGYAVFGTILVFFFSLLSTVQLLQITGLIGNSIQFVPIIIILMFLVMGNFMGKLRPNYFIGIRTPWTLENEEIWIKTHRFGGYIWVIGSLLMLVLAALLNMALYAQLFIAYMVFIIIVPIAYSFLLYRNIKAGK